MNANHIYTPFVYLLVWASGKMYVGSRTKKGKANPTEILTTYFTSSKVVKKYLKAGNTPIQVLVFPFETAKEALEAETKMLTTFNAKTSGAFFNQHNGDGIFSYVGNVHTEETRQKMSSARKGKPAHNKGKPSSRKGITRPPFTLEHRQNMSKAAKGRKRNP